MDARFWRHAYPHVRRLSENGFSIDGGTPATVALARHWTKTRQVNALPPKLAEPVSATPDEAEFILTFCENHRRLYWRRTTTLSALRMESYRVKNGDFPKLWKHSVPGGAALTLVHQDGPAIELTDHRAEILSPIPAWLGAAGKTPPSITHKCLLYGSR